MLKKGRPGAWCSALGQTRYETGVGEKSLHMPLLVYTHRKEWVVRQRHLIEEVTEHMQKVSLVSQPTLSSLLFLFSFGSRDASEEQLFQVRVERVARM